MFVPASIDLTGGFEIAAPPDLAFEFFSPVGEKAWVPGWDPELLHPPGVSWARGQIFRTQEERGEAVWVVVALDRARHDVEYVRVEAGRYVARVRVCCQPGDAAHTRVTVGYTFVGLSDAGNADIAVMSQAAFAEKMARWQEWIGACV